MKEIPLVGWRRTVTLLLLGSASLVVAPTNLHAQETPQIVEVHAETPNNAKDVVIGLRPNAPTTLHLSVQNPGEEELRNVVVKVVQTDREDKVKVLATTQAVDKLPAKAKARLAFPKAKEKDKKEAKDAKDKKDEPDTIEVAGPPFALQLWVEASLGKELVTFKHRLTLAVKQPRDYLTAQAQYDQGKRRFTAKLKFGDSDNVTGPFKCPIQLGLGAELEAEKKGTYAQLLTEPKQAVEVFAEGLAFAGLKIDTGRVSLTVDGYERAFMYPVSLGGSGDLDELPLGQSVGARVRVPRYAKPSEKFPVVLEMDGPTSPDYRVEIALDRAGMKGEFETKKFPGLRQQTVALSFSPAGDLVCHTTVRDWQTEFDTRDVYGSLYFRVSVYKKDELVELLVPRETRPYLAAQEPSEDAKRLFARVTQDDQPIQGVEFVDPPKTWEVGKPLPLTVRARPAKEHQAPVEKRVVFLRGKAPKDGAKIDPETIVGFGEFDEEKSAVNTFLPAPEKAGELELSVQLTNAVGISTYKTTTINIVEPKSKGCKIKGTIAHGPLGQPNLTVFLGDAKGKQLATTKSSAKGEFVFEKVSPGSYLVSGEVTTPALIGVAKVEVPEGKELVDNVLVKLLAK